MGVTGFRTQLRAICAAVVLNVAIPCVVVAASPGMNIETLERAVAPLLEEARQNADVRDFDEAIKQYERILNQLTETGAEETAVAADVHASFGEVLLDSCRLVAAENHFRIALRLFEETGADAAKRIVTLDRLANLLEIEGRLFSSVHVYKAADVLERQLETPDSGRMASRAGRKGSIESTLATWISDASSPQSRSTRSEVAELLAAVPEKIDRGDIANALLWAQKAQKIVSDKLSIDDPFFLLSLTAFWEVGHAAKKENTINNVTAIIDDFFKEVKHNSFSHPGLSARLQLLVASDNLEDGKIDQALEDFLWSARRFMYARSLSEAENHARSLCLAFLAPLSRDERQFEFAEILFTDLIFTNIRLYGANALATSEARMGRATCLSRLGRYQEAETVAIPAHDALLADPRGAWSHVASLTLFLSALMERDGRTQDALSILIRTIARLQRQSAPQYLIDKLSTEYNNMPR